MALVPSPASPSASSVRGRCHGSPPRSARQRSARLVNVGSSSPAALPSSITTSERPRPYQRHSALDASGGGSVATGGSGGRAMSIHPSSLSLHANRPLRVWNAVAPPTTCADASVAWPHRSTSTRGVNHRRSYSVSSLGTTKAVSDRCISRAIACIRLSGGNLSSTATAAGLPAKGSSVNASTTRSVRAIK